MKYAEVYERTDTGYSAYVPDLPGCVATGRTLELTRKRMEKADSVGLCASCKHMRRIESDRGSVFYLCQLSKVDPRFPKYPRLPVLSCIVYEKQSVELTCPTSKRF